MRDRRRVPGFAALVCALTVTALAAPPLLFRLPLAGTTTPGAVREAAWGATSAVGVAALMGLVVGLVVGLALRAWRRERSAAGPAEGATSPAPTAGPPPDPRRALQIEALLRYLPGAAVHLLTPDLRFVFSGGQALATLGLTPAELEGRHVADVAPPELIAETAAVVPRVLAGEALDFEASFGGRDFLFSAVPWTEEDGGVGRILLLAFDVTERKERERLLAESEQRLSLVLAAGRHGIYDLDVRTGEALVNDRYALMLGYDPATFTETNQAWRERLHPDDRDEVYRVYEEYVAGRRDDYVVEFRQRRADGSWSWVLSVGAMVAWDGEGNPLRMVGTHTDISEMKRLELELKERTAFLNAVLDHGPLMYSVFDPDHRLQYANAAFEEYFGWTAEEARRVPDLLSVLYPDTAECERIRDFVRRSDGTWTECRPRRRDGSLGDVAFLSVPLPDGSRIGVGRNLADRRLAEASLARSEEVFRSAVDGAPDAIFIQVREHFVYANGAAVALFGARSEAELIGQEILERIHPADRDAVAERMRFLRDVRRPVPPREATVLRADGAEARCEFSAVPFTFEGEPGAMVFGRDQSERHRTETRSAAQLEDLRRWQAIMLDREDRVAELKREVNRLCHGAGLPPRYPSQEPGG